MLWIQREEVGVKVQSREPQLEPQIAKMRKEQVTRRDKVSDSKLVCVQEVTGGR